MGKKNISVVGGSSGIGLEIVKKLEDNQNEVFVGSRKAPRSWQSQTILVFHLAAHVESTSPHEVKLAYAR